MVARRGGPDSRTTITDVALAAGVNKGTVSRALRGSYGVAPLTRKHILEVAARMNFSASPLASALASGHSRKTVGIVIPTLDSWYFISVASGAKEILTTAGFRVDLIALALDPGYDDLSSAHFYELRNELYAGRDALLVADIISINLRPSGSDDAWPPTASGISLSTVPGSFVDNYAGGQLIAEYLLGLGHRHMAMVDGRKPRSPHPGVWEDRANGFRDAVRAAGSRSTTSSWFRRETPRLRTVSEPWGRSFRRALLRRRRSFVRPTSWPSVCCRRCGSVDCGARRIFRWPVSMVIRCPDSGD